MTKRTYETDLDIAITETAAINRLWTKRDVDTGVRSTGYIWLSEDFQATVRGVNVWCRVIVAGHRDGGVVSAELEDLHVQLEQRHVRAELDFTKFRFTDAYDIDSFRVLVEAAVLDIDSIGMRSAVDSVLKRLSNRIEQLAGYLDEIRDRYWDRRSMQ